DRLRDRRLRGARIDREQRDRRALENAWRIGILATLTQRKNRRDKVDKRAWSYPLAEATSRRYQITRQCISRDTQPLLQIRRLRLDTKCSPCWMHSLKDRRHYNQHEARRDEQLD